MFPKLHPHNLVQLKALLAHPKVNEVWFHGDGNMFVDKMMTDGKVKTAKQHSDDRKIFHNECAANNGAKFRVKFLKTDPIPANLKILEDMLVDNYQDEEAADGQEAETRENSFVFDAPVEEEKKEEYEELVPVAGIAPQGAKIQKGKAKQLAADLAAATGEGIDPNAPVV